MLAYPVELSPDTNGTLLVTFPDFPEATTFGGDQRDALLRAADALETVLAARIDDREDIPLPSGPAGRPRVGRRWTGCSIWVKPRTSIRSSRRWPPSARG